jgi:hypothetical protein
MNNVKNLKKNENYWSWSFEEEPNYRYFTNDDGAGIFSQKIKRETNYANECDVKQLEGTSQFSLRGYSLSGARKKLNRYYEDL